MLILTRKKGERVIIGDSIEITVLGITGGQVRVGVRAPREVSVHREEVYHKLHLAEKLFRGKSAPRPLEATVA